ncbi:MAG TPA: CDP-alcohol phosphatidyltransferase family protein [Stellaceae bacterium]|nr:CDP-alcohol phosphatidyltransferase family protein [Stellaceae bacterium]
MVPDTTPERNLPPPAAIASRRRVRLLEMTRNLPNVITLARLLAVPAALWLILHNRFGAAFWVFVTAGFSDALDGWIAKRWNCRTPLGALLDPAADKALIVGVYLSLWRGGYLPGLLVFLVLLRDFLIVLGYLVIQLKGAQHTIGPIYISKVNTLVQLALVTFVLARLGLGIAAEPLTALLIGAAGLTTVLSGSAYLARWARVLVRSEPAL